MEIENNLEEVSEIEPSARFTSCALSVFVEIDLSLSALQQLFCFAHPAYSLMMSMTLERIHHLLCACCVAEVFFKFSG
jgi:hypothetical protein